MKIDLREWALRELGFFIVEPDTQTYNGQKYGIGTLVYEDGSCHGPSMAEKAMWKVLGRLKDAK